VAATRFRFIWEVLIAVGGLAVVSTAVAWRFFPEPGQASRVPVYLAVLVIDAFVSLCAAKVAQLIQRRSGDWLRNPITPGGVAALLHEFFMGSWKEMLGRDEYITGTKGKEDPQRWEIAGIAALVALLFALLSGVPWLITREPETEHFALFLTACLGVFAGCFGAHLSAFGKDESKE
jgi:hypothetical protein